MNDVLGISTGRSYNKGNLVLTGAFLRLARYPLVTEEPGPRRSALDVGGL